MSAQIRAEPDRHFVNPDAGRGYKVQEYDLMTHVIRGSVLAPDQHAFKGERRKWADIVVSFAVDRRTKRIASHGLSAVDERTADGDPLKSAYGQATWLALGNLGFQGKRCEVELSEGYTLRSAGHHVPDLKRGDEPVLGALHVELVPDRTWGRELHGFGMDRRSVTANAAGYGILIDLVQEAAETLTRELAEDPQAWPAADFGEAKRLIASLVARHNGEEAVSLTVSD